MSPTAVTATAPVTPDVESLKAAVKDQAAPAPQEKDASPADEAAEPKDTAEEEDDDACTLPTREESQARRLKNMEEPLEELLPGRDPESVVMITVMTRRKNLDDNPHFPWDVRATIADMEIIGKRDLTLNSWRGWFSDRIILDVLDLPKGKGLKDINVPKMTCPE